MAEKLIDGPNGEKWNGWLVQDQNEILQITNPKLQTHLRLLARRDDGMNTADYLQEVHTNLEKMVVNDTDDVTLEDVTPWMIKIEERHKFLTEQARDNQPPIKVNFPERAPAIEQPLHIGAVISGGRREMYLVDKGLIELVDMADEDGRRKFILKNLYAYNYLYLKSSEISQSWLSVIKDWEADVNVAQDKNKVLTPEERSEFDKQLKAAMAVTASARAIEISGGSFNDYAVALTGLADGGRGPNAGWQDKNLKYILHADPEKIDILLKDPAIKRYYDRLIADSGLRNDEFLEWNGQKPNNPGLKNPFFGRVGGRKLSTQMIRERSPLVDFLKDSAKNGGFDGYIDRILLNGVSVDDGNFEQEKAAAKLACDIFLVDKWTRWEDLVTDGDASISSKLSLQPCEEFAGDPNKAVIKPTFLPRLKGVYTGPDAIVLDIVDLAFRPTDIYRHISENNVVLYDSPVDHKTRLPVPSMVTNLKTLIRYNAAIDKFFGGPMMANAPSWTSQTMNDFAGGGGVLDLVDQVFGAQKIKVPDDDDPTKTRNFEIGKHIAGDIALRLLYAKALALSLESDAPGFAQKVKILFDPSNKNRPNMEILMMLLGPDRDGTRGLLKAIQGGRLDFVIDRNNVFTAQRYYKELINILQTDDQTGRTSANALNTIGFILDSGTAIANASNLIGGRR